MIDVEEINLDAITVDDIQKLVYQGYTIVVADGRIKEIRKENA